LFVLAIVLLLASLIGSQRLPLVGSLCALTGSSGCGLSPEQQAILFDIRWPRILLAGAVGTSLAAAGAGYQALLRNPLAEPYLLGVSNGAAVGTMTALVFFGAHEWSRPLLAFAGALTATFVVYRLARGRAGASPERLILAGVIVTTFLSSAIVFITTLMDATRIRSFTFWLLGDLSGTTSNLLWIAIIAAAIGVGILIIHARPLNLMMAGERDAFDLGVETGRVRVTVFVAASLLVGASGFEWIRRLCRPGGAAPGCLSFGSDNRLVLPAPDLRRHLWRLWQTHWRAIIAPRELPVGAITALLVRHCLFIC
jgi:iron complex transport system permease protein